VGRVNAFKEALGDDAMWAVVTSTPEDRAAAIDWLTDTIVGVDGQITSRLADLDVWFAAEPRGHNEAKQANAAFKQWRAGAVSFKRRCESRKRQLTADVRDYNSRANADIAGFKAQISKVRELALDADDCCSHCDEWRRDLIAIVGRDWS
jgi:hypothetical protein